MKKLDNGQSPKEECYTE